MQSNDTHSMIYATAQRVHQYSTRDTFYVGYGCNKLISHTKDPYQREREREVRERERGREREAPEGVCAPLIPENNALITPNP